MSIASASPRGPQVRDPAAAMVAVFVWRSRVAEAGVGEPPPTHAGLQSASTGDLVAHEEFGQVVQREQDLGVGADEGGGFAQLVADEHQGGPHMQ